MYFSRLHELPLPNSARLTYRSVRGIYRKTWALKNFLLNLIDCPLIILIYHRVTTLPSDPEMLAVSPENFRRQLEHLKQRHPIVRFDDDWTALDKPAVVITFDDGYADNLLEALPILEELEVPATFFVSSGYLDNKRTFCWHQLESILLRDTDYPASFNLHDPDFGRSWDTATLEQRQALYQSLNLLMQRIDTERQQVWLEQLSGWANFDGKEPEIHRAMTVTELQRLSASPWATIGAHTVSHSALSALTEAQQRQEILNSRLTLQDLTGIDIETFSYPFGRKVDYDQTSVRICREAGFSKVAANFPGQVHRWTDVMQLPRHLVRNWDQATFVAELKGFWTR